MYCFTPYVTPESLKRNADNFNVELVKEDVEMYITEWKITRADGAYTYTLLKTGNDYYLVLDNKYEKFKCMFYVLDGDICIEHGERDGKKLKAASRLKVFSQITMSMWGLIQSGKIS